MKNLLFSGEKRRFLLVHSHPGKSWDLLNPLSASVALILKPVNGFAQQIDWLVSIWGQQDWCYAVFAIHHDLTYEPMLCGFCNPSWLDMWTFWLLVTLLDSSWYHCYDIKRIILTHLQYYHKSCIQGFSLSQSISSTCSFELVSSMLL